MFDCSPAADDGGALDLSTAVFPSSSQEYKYLSSAEVITIDIHVNKWCTTEGESLTGVQISEEGLIQGTVGHSIAERKHNYSLLSGRHWIVFCNLRTYPHFMILVYLSINYFQTLFSYDSAPQTKLLFTHYYHYINYFEQKHMSLYRTYKVQIKHRYKCYIWRLSISSLTNFLGIPCFKPLQLMWDMIFFTAV